MNAPGVESHNRPFRLATRHRWTLLWVTLFALLTGWVAARLGAFDLWTTVQMPDGTTLRFPNVFATVDHPFHATRGELVLRSLREGEAPRWIESHQGGYPAEFYPLGVAWLNVAIWTVSLGSLTMMAAHKIAVILIFLLPGLAFLIAARRDALTPGVALVALASHIAVRGWWWSGGSFELIEWGLVTNVAAAVAALLALIFMTSALARPTAADRDLALASLAGASCLYTNPRSGIALAVAGIGATIAVLSVAGVNRRTVARVASRLAAIAGLVALIAAPGWTALIRFRDLYYFVHYERYDDLGDYLDSSIQAVSGPLFFLGIAGLLVAFLVPQRTVTRAIAATLVLYVLTTAFLSQEVAGEAIVAQLETTRLMPFQRLLMLYLAAIAVHDIARFVWSAVPRFSAILTDATLIVTTGVLVLIYVIAPPSWIPLGDRGLVDVPSTATPSVADLRAAVQFADAEAPSGTAILVLGSPVSWHTNLWAPIWSDRPLFYDDWLWDWHTRHIGPFDPLTEHAYRPAEMAEVLTPDYLQRHGIGAVVIAETARTETAVRAVGTTPTLELARSGIYSVHLVRDATPLVTVDGVNASSIDLDLHRLSATIESPGGEATIRQNWFPRWQATVNGESVPITRRDDGYMSVAVPSGTATVTLNYVIDGWDWFAQTMAALGLIGTLGPLTAGPISRRRRRTGL